MGATGYSLAQIAALTLPQFMLLLEGIGPILYPRLSPLLAEQFAQISSEPEKETGKSPIRDIIDRHYAAKRGERSHPTPKEKERQEAWKIWAGFYLGETEPPAPEAPKAQPIPGLSGDAARAIVDYAKAGRFSDAEWVDVAPIWARIRATAELSA